MENVIYQESPLAAYLEGEGKSEHSYVTPEHAASSSSHHSPLPSFAPHGLPKLSSRIAERLRQPLRINLSQTSALSRIHAAWSRAVNSRVGKADNVRFLEHFRYTIIASQLLDEFPGHGSFKPNVLGGLRSDGTPGLNDSDATATSAIGAIFITSIAFGLAWLFHWSSRTDGGGIDTWRVSLAIAAFVTVATSVYAYARRGRLKRIRQQAVEAASALVTNLHALEASTSATLTLIQEVELVSRGYRISSPLPPISRLEEKEQTKRCLRLRRGLRTAYAKVIPLLTETIGTIRNLIEDESDLEKYYEIYDINNQDTREAFLGYSEDDVGDGETLKALRIFAYRFSTLRRIVLCSFLAIPADGSRFDFIRWQNVIGILELLASNVGVFSENLNEILTGEELFTLPQTSKLPLTPRRERLRAHVHKLGSLSQGIRGLQAKMQLLREETHKTLEESDDASDPVPSLVAEYESIGADLKSLVQAWEAGKSSLAVSIDRHDRRISQSSNGLRSPTTSLGGTTAVDCGSPTDALRALNGDATLRSPTSSVSPSASDEEVFEAIAIPRHRHAMSREERKAKMENERVRQASLRERREANTNMMKELESVIRLRPSNSPSGRSSM